LLWEAEEGGIEVLRIKGIVHVMAGDGTMSSHNVQAVREIYDMAERPLHAKAADAQSRLVLIGRKLDPTGLQAGLSGCVPALSERPGLNRSCPEGGPTAELTSPV
jgi:G3E family GTPase